MQDFSYMTPPESVSFQAMKAKHEEYFARQKRVLDENLSATTWEFLKVHLAADAELPFCFQSIDRVARTAAEGSAVWAATFARNFGAIGGRSRKTDALQELILTIVRRNLTITAPRLLEKLRDPKYRDVIVGVDDDPSDPTSEIEFSTRRGMVRRSPISGIKDRLSRAKKIYRQEIAESR